MDSDTTIPTRRWLVSSVGVVLGGLLLAGCKGIPTKGERAARTDLQTVSNAFRPQPEERNLPTLTSDSALGDYLRFAMLNQPSVESAYFDWAGSVERITIERSLPDPRLTFEADITDIVMTVMPGLMQEFPGPGKLKAAANVATAESRTKYSAFEASVLQTAFWLKRTYYQLWFLDENIRINRTLLNFQLQEVEARTRREIVLADLSLSIAGIAPDGAPVLPPTASTSAPSSIQPTQHEP